MILATTKQAEKKLLTYSALSTYRKCPMRYNLRYEKNLVPVYIDEKLFFGGVIHKALETWHGVDGDFEFRKNLTLEKIDEVCPGWEWSKRRTRLLAKEMMIGYMEKYRNDDLEIVANEYEFDGTIINPRTGAESKTFSLKGKVDGIVKTPGGLFLMEYKTTSKLGSFTKFVG